MFLNLNIFNLISGIVGVKMDIVEFQNKYNGILAEHRYILKEVGDSYLVYIKTIKNINNVINYDLDTHRVTDSNPDYVLTIFFNNDKIKDIRLVKYKYWLDDYTPRKSKQTVHFKSVDDLLKELYEYKI